MPNTEQMHADLKEIYLKYGGRNHRKIVAEMRERGHRFSNWSLSRTKRGRQVGLIHKLKLAELLPREQRSPSVQIGKRASFHLYLKKTEPRWTWDWKFQTHLYEILDTVKRNHCRRLMIFMPPRHGKTETVTVRYSAWRLERDPKLNIILGSYNQRLANRFSRKIKRIVSERVEIAADRSAVDEWETTAGGGVTAVGVGAGVTGFGADLVVIDDPIKSRAEAESIAYRDRVWDWFNDDIHTRLEPDAAIILIQTRWHEDDLAGRLLKKMEDGGEQWTVLSLPALAEPDDPLDRKEGDALCAKRFNRETLLRKKRQIGSYSFAALYQQHPVPLEGSHFKRSWFDGKIIDEAPPALRWCRGYDLAVSTKTSADYTASFRCAIDRQGNVYIADGFRKRIEFPEQRRYIIDRITGERNTQHGIESALHGLAIVQDLRREVRLASGAFRPVRVDTDKVTRALAWANRAEEGKVFLVRGPWIDDFLDELCSFPKGKHDDQVDAVGIAIKMLSEQRNRLHTF